jgi:esterase/lipase superfamily enzyme
VRQAAYIDSEKAFVRALNARLDVQPRGKRKVLVFIHGYNTNFAEGLYRFAQIVQDSGSSAVPVLFTWASQGSFTDYVYDTNSATIARDDLEHTFRSVAASDADEINIVAHSMGNWVTVEALRQIKISGDTTGANKIGAVVLAAPDIDLDVFKSQMRRIGRPRKPFFIIVSKDDKALRFSRLIAGGKPRLGADSDVQELAALGAIVIDLTTLKGADALNHAKFAQLASVAPALAHVLQEGIAANSASLPKDKAAIGGTLASFVTLPVRIIAAPRQIAAGVQ